jgi:protein-L-isoaspartate(D-aspartate) O-methyltransferase
MTDFAAARHNMIESQVRPNGVTDRRIIAAMSDLPREHFVPDGRRAIAYLDGDVALAPADAGQGPRALIAAMPFARLLQHAAIRPSDKVLVVGAGTGYGAAVVAALAAHVVALECDPGLAAEARANLAGLANVKVVEGRLESGDSADGPFDVIVLEGRVGEVPQALIDQLADGGRLVAVVGEAELAKACVFSRSGPAVASRAVFDAAVAPLPGFRKVAPAFVF